MSGYHTDRPDGGERSAAPTRPRNYGDSAGPNVPMPQRLRRDRLLELLRSSRGCSTASELTEVMARREHMALGEEHAYPYGMCCDDLNELERYGLARFYPGVPKLWEAVPTQFRELESDHPDIRPELDTQDDDDVWRRRENVKWALTQRGVRLHDSVVVAIVEAACDPTLRHSPELKSRLTASEDELDRLAAALHDWNREHGGLRQPYDTLIEPTRADLRELAGRLKAELDT